MGRISCYTTEAWVKKAKERWDGIREFDYSKVEYKDKKTPVKIGCPVCKKFQPIVLAYTF